MSRGVACVVLALALAGCSLHSRHEEIKDIGGRDYICTWVENNISGNPSEYTCYPAAVAP